MTGRSGAGRTVMVCTMKPAFWNRGDATIRLINDNGRGNSESNRHHGWPPNLPNRPTARARLCGKRLIAGRAENKTRKSTTSRTRSRYTMPPRIVTRILIHAPNRRLLESIRMDQRVIGVLWPDAQSDRTSSACISTRAPPIQILTPGVAPDHSRYVRQLLSKEFRSFGRCDRREQWSTKLSKSVCIHNADHGI